MKKIIFVASLIFWSAISLSLAEEPALECYEFTPVSEHNVKSALLCWQKNSAKSILVKFKVTLANKIIDEGISPCYLEQNLNYRCVRDDGGGELTLSLGEKPRMKVSFWYLGIEGSENPPSLPSELTGRKLKAAKP